VLRGLDADRDEALECIGIFPGRCKALIASKRVIFRVMLPIRFLAGWIDLRPDLRNFGYTHLKAIAETSMRTAGTECFRLPPLILHPFSTSEDTSVLMESSRASLALQGFLPRDATPLEDLDRQLLRGRYAELRMLFYIGKDITRWTDQCTETVRAYEDFICRCIRPETFAVLLIRHTPAPVRLKLEAWGVLDFTALFRRAFALHAVFQELPTVDLLSPDFLRRYHPYLDQWYESRLKEFVFENPTPNQFVFDLYASGEYTSMLEESWGSSDA